MSRSPAALAAAAWPPATPHLLLTTWTTNEAASTVRLHCGDPSYHCTLCHQNKPQKCWYMCAPYPLHPGERSRNDLRGGCPRDGATSPPQLHGSRLHKHLATTKGLFLTSTSYMVLLSLPFRSFFTKQCSDSTFLHKLNKKPPNQKPKDNKT